MNFINKKYKNIVLLILILGLICLICKNYILDIVKIKFKKIVNSFETFSGTCEPQTICDDKSLSHTLKDVNLHKKNTPNFYYESQKDFGYHSENLRTTEAEDLYNYLQKMVTAGHNQYDLTSSSTKKFKSSDKGEKVLLKFLSQKINQRVENIQLIDDIYYFKNQTCLDIQPFQIVGDYTYNNKYYGKVKIQIELTFRFDQPNEVFISQSVFNNYSGIFKINRVTLITHQTEKEVINVKKNLPVRLEKPLTYSKYNFSYDNKDGEAGGLDTINSLIPEEIEITEYEKDSEENSTQKVDIL
jgi:hypothetical protein